MSLNCLTISVLRKLMYVFIFMQKKAKKKKEMCPKVHFFFFQKSRSTKQQVVLTNLSLASGGTYKCEVSAEAPSFRTKFAKQDMVVVVLPSKAEIVGIQPKYQVGDLVNVTCFSYRYIILSLYISVVYLTKVQS